MPEINSKRISIDMLNLSTRVNSQPDKTEKDSTNNQQNVFKADLFTDNTGKNPLLKSFADLDNIFNGKTELKTGDKGNSVIALQRSLVTLGYSQIKKIDGIFGEKSTLPALKQFQKDNKIKATGKLDKVTLIKLNDALNKKASEPIIIPDMTPINIKAKSWESPELKAAYGKFVNERWEFLKGEVVETDCKGLALKFLSDFIQYYKEQTGIKLPYPGGKNGVQEVKPVKFNSKETNGWNGDLPSDSTRDDYKGFKKLKEAYPDESLIRGTNYYFPGIGADYVAKKMIKQVISGNNSEPIINEHPENMSIRKMQKKPEVDINQLEAGDIIFIDHTDGGKSWDHTVNILDVNKREDGSVKSIKMAVAAYDDLMDRKAETPPEYPNINFYSEEVLVKFDQNGKITSSKVNWSSEPFYINSSRYNATNTLMELKKGGTLMVGRWTD